MALTVGNLTYDTRGSRQAVEGTLAFDSSYPKGGESLTAAMLGLAAIVEIRVEPTNGYALEYDHTNAKLKAFYAQALGIPVLNTTAVGNVTTGEDNLISFTLPANTLSVNGMGLRVTYSGVTANNANAKTLKAYLGTTALLTTSLTANQASVWKAVIEIIRTGAATQDVTATLLQGGSTSIVDVEHSEPTEDLTAALAVKATGEATSTDDIINELQMIELLVPQGTGTVGAEVVDATSLAGLTGVRFVAVGY